MTTEERGIKLFEHIADLLTALNLRRDMPSSADAQKLAENAEIELQRIVAAVEV